nr:MAK10-like protein [Tanacetum cinerariifolium]
DVLQDVLPYLFRNPFSSTTMGDENPIRTLGDYSKPCHEGYRNTIDLPGGNNVVPLRSNTIRLVQKGCSFYGLRSKDLNQHLKDFLKPVDSLDLDGENKERTRLRLFHFSLRDQCEIDHAASDKLCNKNADESWEIIEDLALYDHEGWDDTKEFVKLVKAITASQGITKTPDRRLLELEDQINFLRKYQIPITKNANSISLARNKEEENYKKDETPDNANMPTETKMTVRNAEAINGAENGSRNESIKTPKNEEVVDASGSQPIAYYLKHKINEKLIKGLVNNNRFNNSRNRGTLAFEVFAPLLVELHLPSQKELGILWKLTLLFPDLRVMMPLSNLIEALAVVKNGVPKMKGLFSFSLMSKTTKSTGNTCSTTSANTSSAIPKG